MTDLGLTKARPYAVALFFWGDLFRMPSLMGGFGGIPPRRFRALGRGVRGEG